MASTVSADDNRRIRRSVALESGETMAYTTQGLPPRRGGQVVLLVHGWPMNADLYAGISQSLCGPEDTDYFCITPSMVAFGRSSCPDDPLSITPPSEAAFMAEFIDAVSERFQFSELTFVGHDWGGSIGLKAIADKTADGTITMTRFIPLDTFVNFGHIPFERRVLNRIGSWLQGLAGPVSGPAFVDAVIRLLTVEDPGFFELVRFWLPYSSFTRGGIDVGVCRQIADINLFATAKDSETISMYDDIAEYMQTSFKDGPTCFILAEEDWVEGSASNFGCAAHCGVQALAPQGNVRNLPEASHYMQLDQPEVIAAWMKQFLDDPTSPETSCPADPPLCDCESTEAIIANHRNQ
ncbi:MAG: alpha/beta hydrolase [Myxococcota bacterium]